jgi:hypothetical protein
MFKSINILLIIIMGVSSLPFKPMACGSRTEKSCCTKKSEMKECCKKSKKKSEENHKCGGKCKDKSCNCPVSSLSFTLPITIEIHKKNWGTTIEKQKFNPLTLFPSSGFSNIWTPPNIV